MILCHLKSGCAAQPHWYLDNPWRNMKRMRSFAIAISIARAKAKAVPKPEVQIMSLSHVFDFGEHQLDVSESYDIGFWQVLIKRAGTNDLRKKNLISLFPVLSELIWTDAQWQRWLPRICVTADVFDLNAPESEWCVSRFPIGSIHGDRSCAETGRIRF